MQKSSLSSDSDCDCSASSWLPRLWLAAFAVCAVSALGCKPNYPTCSSDKDCKPKEFCVARKCQQCRTASDCQAGFDCNAGKCAAIPGFCSDKSQCAEGEECIANRCRACEEDTQCPSGLKCVAGRCAKAECATDDDCPQDKDCVSGKCISVAPAAPSGPPCALTPLYFPFDDAALSAEARNTLAANVECLKKADRPVNLVGHCDPRGTDEYNLALSDRRAQSVKTYVERLGIPAARLRPLPRGALDATGTDEAGWARDRRVELQWQ